MPGMVIDQSSKNGADTIANHHSQLEDTIRMRIYNDESQYAYVLLDQRKELTSDARVCPREIGKLYGGSCDEPRDPKSY
jgi:hypothetical protein